MVLHRYATNRYQLGRSLANFDSHTPELKLEDSGIQDSTDLNIFKHRLKHNCTATFFSPLVRQVEAYETPMYEKVRVRPCWEKTEDQTTRKLVTKRKQHYPKAILSRGFTAAADDICGRRDETRPAYVRARNTMRPNNDRLPCAGPR